MLKVTPIAGQGHRFGVCRDIQDVNDLGPGGGWFKSSRRLIQPEMPPAAAEAAAGPAQSWMRSAPMAHLSRPARASVLRRSCWQPPCPLLPRSRSDYHWPRPSGQAEGLATARLRIDQLRPSTHHSQRPVSRRVEQRLARQPVAVVQEFSDRAALTRLHRCSPPIPGRPPWPEDHQERPRPPSARDAVAVTPPTAAGRPIRHRLAPARRC
jgi:hypothetical protein